MSQQAKQQTNSPQTQKQQQPQQQPQQQQQQGGGGGGVGGTTGPSGHTTTEQMGSQILHVHTDSDSELEALFKAVMHPTDSKVALIIPMRLRNLPASFFNPPDTGSRTSAAHSRESSTDSSAAFGPSSGGGPPAPGSTNVIAGGQVPSPSHTNSGLVIHHPRAHSSPASLQQTYASAQNIQQQQHQHIRHQSYDITDETPLPPGWDMAKTPSGQRYFLK